MSVATWIALGNVFHLFAAQVNKPSLFWFRRESVFSSCHSRLQSDFMLCMALSSFPHSTGTINGVGGVQLQLFIEKGHCGCSLLFHYLIHIFKSDPQSENVFFVGAFLMNNYCQHQPLLEIHWVSCNWFRIKAAPSFDCEAAAVNVGLALALIALIKL